MVVQVVRGGLPVADLFKFESFLRTRGMEFLPSPLSLNRKEEQTFVLFLRYIKKEKEKIIQIGLESRARFFRAKKRGQRARVIATHKTPHSSPS